MKTANIASIIILLVTFSSCKKEAGDGGNSSIKGKISREIRVVLNNPSTAIGTFPAADEDVFIIYGGHVSPDDRVQTNYNGEYEFLYLRPGKYTVYAFSADTNSVAVPWDEDHMTVLQELEITDGEQTIVASDMTLYDAN
jgi:hypothetical protein